MEDGEIVGLYWARDQRALTETRSKYGGYCHAIAGRLLGDERDCEECVNDVWLVAWRSIPPQRPETLKTYLGKLTRRVALNRLRDRDREKRGGGQTALCLEELSECLPGGTETESGVELRELTRAIDGFLKTLSAETRNLFVCRYWFMTPVKELSARFGFSESKVKSSLARARGKLLQYLEKSNGVKSRMQ